METVVVHGVTVVDIQLAAVIGVKSPMVTAAPRDLDFTSPTHSEVLGGTEAWPIAVGIGIQHPLDDPSPRWTTSPQVWNISHVVDVVVGTLLEAFLPFRRTRNRLWFGHRFALRLAEIGPGVV
jgi:hypothetical protein